MTCLRSLRRGRGVCRKWDLMSARIFARAASVPVSGAYGERVASACCTPLCGITSDAFNVDFSALPAASVSHPQHLVVPAGHLEGVRGPAQVRPDRDDATLVHSSRHLAGIALQQQSVLRHQPIDALVVETGKPALQSLTVEQRPNAPIIVRRPLVDQAAYRLEQLGILALAITAAGLRSMSQPLVELRSRDSWDHSLSVSFQPIRRLSTTALWRTTGHLRANDAQRVLPASSEIGSGVLLPWRNRGSGQPPARQRIKPEMRARTSRY